MRITFNWGFGVGLAYILFALATIGFVAFAMTRSVDLVSDDYYAQSLRLDARMQAERNTRALRPAPSVVQTAARTALLSLPLEQAAATAGTLTLYRPSDATADRVLPLGLDSKGRQHVSLEGLVHGSWILQVSWSTGGRDYYFEQPVFAQ
jgi:hypothetical protein